MGVKATPKDMELAMIGFKHMARKSFATVDIFSLILLLTLIHMVWWLAILEALLIGICVSLAELFTKKGMDTITCPIVSAIILFLFSLI